MVSVTLGIKCSVVVIRRRAFSAMDCIVKCDEMKLWQTAQTQWVFIGILTADLMLVHCMKLRVFKL